MQRKRNLFATRIFVSLIALLTAATAWAGNVSYIDENGQQKTQNCSNFPSNPSSLSTGWYVVTGEITNTSSRLTINGDVKLILADGCRLWYVYGIEVSSGNSLTIYGQSASSGNLWITSYNNNGHVYHLSNSNAAIGQTNNGSCGTIKIHGGTIIAHGGTYSYLDGGHEKYSEGSCGIGGSGGSITITGGTVTASGGHEAAGIGDGSNVTITGGTVTAHGGGTRNSRVYSAAGIGSSVNRNSNCGTITITGGKVTAYRGGDGSHGIGTSYNGSGGTIKISGGEITAEAIGGSNVNTELGWTKSTDYIHCTNSYSGTVKLNKQFHADGTVFNSGTVSDNSTINGKKLIAYTLEGAGTQSSPYLISSSENWVTFCQCLKDNNTWNRFANKYVKLTNDITVNMMAGSDNHDFCGIFDGGGHKLTFNYGSNNTYSNEAYIAPFSYVSNADNYPVVIQNLWVAGDIYTNNVQAGGIISRKWGKVTIENCRVSMNIHSNYTGNAGHGGLVSTSNDGDLTIRGCLFDGSILGSSSTDCGGFVGYRSKAAVDIYNSLFAPTSVTATTNSATFARNCTSSVHDNCYYTTSLGTVQGKQAYSISGGTAVTATLTGTSTVYDVSGITVFNKGMKYNNVSYAGNNDQVSVALSCSDTSGRGVTYAPSSGTLTGSSSPYTLTMPAANVTMSAVYHASPLLGYSSTYDPDGSAQKPYIISSAEGWNYFCSAIENSSLWNHFSGKTIRLDANITVTTMAGSSSHQFAGIFDGNNKTLTFNKTASEAYCAPFRYVNGATIKRLTVAGTVSNSGKQTGGLIAYAKDNNTIDHCVVTASLTSSYSGNASNGGFIAHMESGTTAITDCVFKGRLLGSSAYASAGFVGWVSNGQVNFTNSFFAPAEVTMGTSDSQTFNRNNKNSFTNCYYTTVFGGTQGTAQVYTSSQASFTKKLTAAGGVAYYLEGTTAINNVSSVYNYTGSTIAITPTVTFDGATVSSSNYTVSITPSPVKEMGEYTLTITGKNDYAGTKSTTFKVMSALPTDASGAYTISNADQWGMFCDYIESRGETFSGKTVKLTDDIEVSRMAGNTSTKFSGIFDGGGHKLTFNHTAQENYCAPFRYINGATIKRLTIDGCIELNSSYSYAGGLVSSNSGNSTIEDCTNNITILINNFNTYNGGFVGKNENYATLSFERCTFSGSIKGSTTRTWLYSAGFVGYNNNYSIGTVAISFTDCLFNPTAIEVGTYDCYTFYNQGNASFTRTYYTKVWVKAQGQAAYKTVPDEGVFKSITVNGTDLYTEVEASADLSDSYVYHDTPIVVAPTVTIDGQTASPDTYTMVVKDADGNDVTSGIESAGCYTLTVTTDGTAFSGSKSFPFTVMSYLAGNGTATEPYLINDADDWKGFAFNISIGKNLSAYYKLTGSFETDVMVGDNSHMFSGRLDGNNQTLTFNKSDYEYYLAPFRYVDGATIEKLTVAGTVSNRTKQTGGLIGYAKGNNTIDHCVVTASITSSYSGDASNGGFIAHMENGTTAITNSVFKGRLLGSSAYASAGFVGWVNDGQVNFSNCLFAPAELTMGTTNSCTFNRNNKNSFTNCYFTTAFNEAQGLKVSDTHENRVYTPVTAADGNTYYRIIDITGVNPTYVYDNGNVIAVVPIVKLDGEPMSTNDYTITIKDADNNVVQPGNLKEIGSYTLTVSGKGSYTGSQVIDFGILTGTSLDGYVFATEGEGDDIVYLINNEADLERLAAYVNSGHKASGMTFKLTDDIDMKKEHTAIGTNNDTRFQGTFLGNNKTISHLTIDKQDSNYQGLFGYVYDGTVIQDLTLVDCTVTGKYSVGGIVGCCSGASNARITIKNCHVKNIRNSGVVAEARNHGGIAGYTYQTEIIDCTASGEITSTINNDNYGGIAGNLQYGSITNCENTASISNPGQLVGGIAGTCSHATFTNCLNTGSVSGGTKTGGIAGDGATYSTFSKCYYTNDMKAVNGSDPNGTSRVYTIAGDNHIASINIAEGASVTSTAGTKYYEAGDWTLTLTMQEGLSAVALSCEGGTLADPALLTGNTLTINNADVVISAIVSQNAGVDMADVTIADIPEQRWKGTDVALQPALTMSYNGTPLTPGTDCLVKFTDNTAVGTATITVTGINGYKGTRIVNFTIADFPLVNPDADNSAENPYQIATEDDLEALASLVNTGARNNGYYRQVADIECTGEHTAIGLYKNYNSQYPFKGTFDGNNLTISNLTINKAESEYQGLFGLTQNATVENVILIDCQIKGKNYVGGIVGYSSGSDGVFRNCFVTGHVEGTSYVGAIIGRELWTTLSNNYYTACNVKGIGTNNTVGYNSQGEAECVAKITAGDNVSLTLPDNAAYTLNGQRYYKSGVEVELDYSLPEGNYFYGYSVNNGTISNAAFQNGKHKLENFSSEVVITGSHSDQQVDLADGAVIADIQARTYNGTVQHPEPVVTIGNSTLTKDVNYVVSWSDDCTNAGEHTITVTGKDGFKGTVTKVFTISPYNISGCNVTLANPNYTGEEIALNPTVRRSGTMMTEGADNDYTFVVDPATVKTVGDYTMTVTGHGNYTGTKEVNFSVVYAVPTSLACTTLTPTSATLTWTETGVATQWTLEYSTDNTFATSESITVDATTATLADLTAETIYYARVKAVYGENEESDWSTIGSFEPTRKLTVGSGTNSYEYLPFSNYYNYSLTQQIYTANELNHQAGTIRSLDFFKVSDNNCRRTIDIYLVMTDKDVFKDWQDWIKVTEADKVFSGEVNFDYNVWTSITLDTPFDYDGRSNLALIVDDNTGSYNGTTKFLVFYGEKNNQTIYQRTDRTNYNPETLEGVDGNANRTSYKTQLRIGFDNIELADNATDNSSIVSENNELKKSVKLSGRTLYKDGEWNTICLPFEVTLAGSPLEGAIAKTLVDATMTGTTVSLTFGEAVKKLEAGVPYIIKWTKANDYEDDAEHNIVDPVFTDVKVVSSSDADMTISKANGNVKFIGYYDAFTINTPANDDIYYMTAGNTLKHTGKQRTLKACRAYFQFSEAAASRSFEMNFGDETTDIAAMRNENEQMRNDGTGWYTLDGVKLDKKPTRKGLYIFNGHKVVIK